MPRAIAVLPAAERDNKPISDTLLLSHEQRASPHGDFVALRGTKVEIVIREALRAEEHQDDEEDNQRLGSRKIGHEGEGVHKMIMDVARQEPVATGIVATRRGSPP